jgi:hypothetical protein
MSASERSRFKSAASHSARAGLYRLDGYSTESMSLVGGAAPAVSRRALGNIESTGTRQPARSRRACDPGAARAAERPPPRATRFW